MTKTCSKCREELASSEFHKMSQSKDGLRPSCKTCRQKNTRIYRETYGNEIRDRKRRRYHEQRDRLRAMRRATKHKIAARNTVNNAIASGSLVRVHECSQCGSPERVEAHHANYAPENHLNVVWLCRRCHAQTHARSKPERIRL